MAIEVALEAFTPWGLVAARLVVGSTVLLGLQRLRGGRLLPRPEDMARVAVLGGVLALHMVLQAIGLTSTSAVNTGWIIAAIPAVIALGAHVFLGQRMAARGWLGVLIASAGVLTVVGVRGADLADARFGDLLQIASCFTWAAYTLGATQAVSGSGALAVTAGTMLVAALVGVPAAWVTGFTHATPDATAWFAFAFLGVACSAAAYLLWYQALSVLGPVRTATTLYCEPFFTLATSVVVLGEAGGGNTLVGGVTVLAGVFLVQGGLRRAEAASGRGDG